MRKKLAKVRCTKCGKKIVMPVEEKRVRRVFCGMILCKKCQDDFNKEWFDRMFGNSYKATEYKGFLFGNKEE